MLPCSPRDMRTMLATVPFQIGTSTTSSSPFAPDIVTFTVTSQPGQGSSSGVRAIITCLVVEVMESMEHMKMSATMKTATKL